MEQLVPYLPLLIMGVACPVLMGGAMWLMMRQMNSPQMPMHAKTQSPVPRIQTLQAQREMLDQEIRELERIQALQTQREQLTQTLAHTGEARG